MIEIFGKKYLTDKEAAQRYGKSQKWFIRQRWLKQPPKYTQFNERGRVLYPLDETDSWFLEKMKIKE